MADKRDTGKGTRFYPAQVQGSTNEHKKGGYEIPLSRRLETAVYCFPFLCSSASRLMRATTLKPRKTKITMASATIVIDNQVTTSQVSKFTLTSSAPLLKLRTIGVARPPEKTLINGHPGHNQQRIPKCGFRMLLV